MTLIRIQLSQDAARIVERLAAFPPALARGIARALDLENELTIGEIQRTKLSGPRPEKLGVVTNRLRSSIARSDARIDGASVRSAIGTNVEYAAIHEFGFDGIVQVPAHSRRIIRAARTTATGLDARGRLRSRTRVTRQQTGTAQVRAHSRHMRMPERSFIRSTITERVPAYEAALSSAIISAWSGGAQ